MADTTAPATAVPKTTASAKKPVAAPPKPPAKPEQPKPTEPAATTEGNGKACLITRTQFRESAPAAVQINDVIKKKEFATGTLGYYGQITVVVTVDGVPMKLRGQAQLFVDNSKNAVEG